MKTILSIKIKPNSKHQSILKDDKIKNRYFVSVKNPPYKGLANAELVKILSEHFKIPKNNILIIKGAKNTDKLVRILT